MYDFVSLRDLQSAKDLAKEYRCMCEDALHVQPTFDSFESWLDHVYTVKIREIATMPVKLRVIDDK
jgi:hypothetical protein